ncbi:MAG: carbohydrate kinase family protein [Promethearchaeota archaeon]
MVTGAIDVCILGYITDDFYVSYEKDEVKDPVTIDVPGGITTYSSKVSTALGYRTGIVATVGEDFFNKEKFESLRKDKMLDLRGVVAEGEKTTNLYLIIPAHGYTIGILRHLRENILPKHIPAEYLMARAMHIGPLVGEVPLDTVKFIKEHSKTAVISLDVQSYVRKLNDFSKLETEDYEKLSKYLSDEQMEQFKQERAQLVKLGSWEECVQFAKFVDIMKANVYEACSLAGLDIQEEELKETDNQRIYAYRALDVLEEKFAEHQHLVFVITLGEGGALVCQLKGKMHPRIYVPAAPASSVIDSTGAGDTFMISFLIEYSKTKDLLFSTKYALATSSVSVESAGPFPATPGDVIRRYEEAYGSFFWR